MRLFFGVGMVFFLFACRAVKVTKALRAEKRESAVTIRKTDVKESLNETEKLHTTTQVITKDSSTLTTYILSQPATMEAITSGKALVAQVIQQENKIHTQTEGITHKEAHKKTATTTATKDSIRKEQSETITLKESTQKIPSYRWIAWVIGSFAGLAGLVYIAYKIKKKIPFV